MEAMANTSFPNRSILACAIDAQALSQQINGPISPSRAAITTQVLHQRRFKEIDGYILNYGEASSHGFLPEQEGSWYHIAANLDFLKALTASVPCLSPTPNLSRPASTLTHIFISTNHTSILPVNNTEYYARTTPFKSHETIISTLVADGLSRVSHARQLDSVFYANGAT